MGIGVLTGWPGCSAVQHDLHRLDSTSAWFYADDDDDDVFYVRVDHAILGLSTLQAYM